MKGCGEKRWRKRKRIGFTGQTREKKKNKEFKSYDQTKIKRGMFALLAQSGIKLTPEM